MRSQTVSYSDRI